MIISLPITLWFYGLYVELPNQKETQIALSLMVGVDIWFFARLLELLTRFISFDFNGFRYRTLFYDESLNWESLRRIEWWYIARGRVTSYRLWTGDNKPLVTLSTDTWSRLNEGIGYAIERRKLEPLQIAHRSELNRLAILILTPLAVALFSFGDSDVLRVIGFALIRLFWAALVWNYPRHELRAAQFYLALLSMAVIAALILVSGSSFQSTLIWWLYTPLIEVVVSVLLTEVPRLLSKASKQLRAEQE